MAEVWIESCVSKANIGRVSHNEDEGLKKETAVKKNKQNKTKQKNREGKKPEAPRSRGK